MLQKEVTRGNFAPKKFEKIKAFRKWRNEELHNVYFTHLRVTKSRRMGGWMGYVAHIVGMENKNSD
jgi:hypothetical protein